MGSKELSDFFHAVPLAYYLGEMRTSIGNKAFILQNILGCMYKTVLHGDKQLWCYSIRCNPIDLDAAFPAFLVYMINKLKVLPSVCFSWVAVPSLQRISHGFFFLKTCVSWLNFLLLTNIVQCTGCLATKFLNLALLKRAVIFIVSPDL